MQGCCHSPVPFEAQNDGVRAIAFAGWPEPHSPSVPVTRCREPAPQRSEFERDGGCVIAHFIIAIVLKPPHGSDGGVTVDVMST
jgi:hypothetical protein